MNASYPRKDSLRLPSGRRPGAPRSFAVRLMVPVLLVGVPLLAAAGQVTDPQQPLRVTSAASTLAAAGAITPGPTEPGPTEPGPTEPEPTEPEPTEPEPTEPTPTAAVPSPPSIDRPVRGSRITDRRPSIAGSGDPRGRITVIVDDQTLCVNTPVKEGRWSCTPRADLPLGRVKLTATQQIGNTVSGVAHTSFVVAPGRPVITSPKNRWSTTTRRVAVAGRGAVQGATVQVSEEGTEVCTARAGRNGRWSCRSGTALRPGRHRIYAVQVVARVESSRSAPVAFRVRRQEPQPTPASSPAPAPPQLPTPTPMPELTPAPPPTSTPTTAAAPTAKPTIEPEPKPKPTRAPRPTRTSAPTDAGRPSRPLAVALGAPSEIVAPGQLVRYDGAVGPNTSDARVSLTITGSASKGLRYRSIVLQPHGSCVVRVVDFSCSARLRPGESLAVSLRLLVDALTPPSSATQRFSVSSSLPSQDNQVTVTASMKDAPEGLRLATAIQTFPGALIPLLALLMFALACTETDRRRRRRP